MANRRIVNGTYANQTKLPPIQRNYDVSRNQIDIGHDNITLHFPRLPRIERNALGKSKTPLRFHGREENQYSCLTADEQRPPFHHAAKICGKPFDKINVLQQLNQNEKLDTQIGRSGRMCRESNCMRKTEIQISPITEKVSQRTMRLLRRRFKPARAYQHNNGQLSHEELLVFDQNMDQLRTFTERDVKWIEVKDFNGKKIDRKKTGSGDITSYIEQFERLEEKKNSSHDEVLPLTKQTKVRVQGRFYEALDLHYYHHYRNTHPGRRMAICEEIERSVFVDDVALTVFREHLSLQEIINTWVV